jgi:hypothetical protein
VIVAAVNGAPDRALLEAVSRNLYGHELMAFDVRVKPPDILPVDIEIEYTGEAGETGIRLVAGQYVYGLTIGGRFAVRDLYAAFAGLNLTTIEILSPDRDTRAEALYVVAGTITVTKLEAAE